MTVIFNSKTQNWTTSLIRGMKTLMFLLLILGVARGSSTTTATTNTVDDSLPANHPHAGLTEFEKLRREVDSLVGMLNENKTRLELQLKPLSDRMFGKVKKAEDDGRLTSDEAKVLNDKMRLALPTGETPHEPTLLIYVVCLFICLFVCYGVYKL
eukprot:749228_1